MLLLAVDLRTEKVASLAHELGTGSNVKITGVVYPLRRAWTIIVKLHYKSGRVTMNNEKAVVTIIGNQELWQGVKVSNGAHGRSILGRGGRWQSRRCRQSHASGPVWQQQATACQA